MKKSIMRIFVATMMIVALLSPAGAFAAQKPITVDIDGYVMSFETPPFIENGTTLVPMREIFEAFQMSVTWDGKTKTVYARTEYMLCIELQIGNPVAQVYYEDYSNYDPITETGYIGKGDPSHVTLSVPAKIVNNKTFVPIRFVSETMGYDVNWDNKTRQITILTGVLSAGEYESEYDYNEYGYGDYDNGYYGDPYDLLGTFTKDGAYIIEVTLIGGSEVGVSIFWNDVNFGQELCAFYNLYDRPHSWNSDNTILTADGVEIMQYGIYGVYITEDPLNPGELIITKFVNLWP